MWFDGINYYILQYNDDLFLAIVIHDKGPGEKRRERGKQETNITYNTNPTPKPTLNI